MQCHYEVKQETGPYGPATAFRNEKILDSIFRADYALFD